MAPSKAQLRQTLRRARLAMTDEVWQRDSALVVERVLTAVEAVPIKTVALYSCIERFREVDLGLLDRWLRTRGVRTAYPVMSPSQRGFVWVSDPQTLLLSEGAFRQPIQPWEWVEPGSLDLVIVPMLGFSPDLNRLGYGAGFYDQVLPRFRPPALAIGVAFQLQALPTLPFEAHDQRCDLIVTEQHYYGEFPI